MKENTLKIYKKIIKDAKRMLPKCGSRRELVYALADKYDYSIHTIGYIFTAMGFRTRCVRGPSETWKKVFNALKDGPKFSEELDFAMGRYYITLRLRGFPINRVKSPVAGVGKSSARRIARLDGSCFAPNSHLYYLDWQRKEALQRIDDCVAGGMNTCVVESYGRAILDGDYDEVRAISTKSKFQEEILERKR